MKLPANLDQDTILAAVEEGMYGLSDIGFCMACGAEAYQIEPDARKYTCESCGEKKVYGAEEIMFHIIA